MKLRARKDEAARLGKHAHGVGEAWEKLGLKGLSCCGWLNAVVVPLAWRERNQI